MKQALLILTTVFTFSVFSQVKLDRSKPSVIPVRGKADKVLVKANPLELLNKAIAKAKESNKLVLVVVETPNIDHAQRNLFGVHPRARTSVLVKLAILNDDKFKSFVSDNIVSLTVDSKDPLAKELGLTHPMLMLMDADGKKLRTDSTKYKWKVEGKESWMELDISVNGLIKDYTKHIVKDDDKIAK